MDHDIDLKNMNALPFSKILGAPMQACIKAQKESAVSTYDFIRESCFDPETGEAVTVSFTFRVGRVESKIVLPLMTVVPIPNLTIDTLDVSFGASISDYGRKEDRNSFKGYFAESVPESRKNSDQNTDYSEKSSSADLDIRMHASKGDMPGGFIKLLEILDKSIEVERLSDDLEELPSAELLLNKHEVFAYPGDRIDFEVTLNGEPVDPADLMWRSSNLEILSVEEGYAVLWKHRCAVLSVESVDGLRDTCIIRSPRYSYYSSYHRELYEAYEEQEAAEQNSESPTSASSVHVSGFPGSDLLDDED